MLSSRCHHPIPIHGLSSLVTHLRTHALALVCFQSRSGGGGGGGAVIKLGGLRRPFPPTHHRPFVLTPALMLPWAASPFTSMEWEGVLVKVHSNVVIVDGGLVDPAPALAAPPSSPAAPAALEAAPARASAGASAGGAFALRSSSNLSDRSWSQRPCDTELGIAVRPGGGASVHPFVHPSASLSICAPLISHRRVFLCPLLPSARSRVHACIASNSVCSACTFTDVPILPPAPASCRSMIFLTPAAEAGAVFDLFPRCACVQMRAHVRMSVSVYANKWACVELCG